MTSRQAVESILRREDPGRFVYAPNYWQWFSHHQRHGSLPPELGSCRDQFDMLDHLGVDGFSRNIYCDQRRCWFGGLTEEEIEGSDCEITEEDLHGGDLQVTRRYHLPGGVLTDVQRHVSRESTLVQEKFLIDDYENQLPLLEQFIERRRWRFDPARWASWIERVGSRGVICAGEVVSPLKLLHLVMGPEATTYFVCDEPERAAELLRTHEQAQLDLIRQICSAGVPSIMAMDNLDSVFHTPAYIEEYSASFYQKASSICHEHGSTFFIHACGNQKENLARIASYGVDGLEGVAYPPLGNTELDEAFELTGDRFLITGGISAMETRDLQTRQEVFNYLGGLFERMRPYRHRFMLAASCNTAINARWETLLHFRDAWRELA